MTTTTIAPDATHLTRAQLHDAGLDPDRISFGDWRQGEGSTIYYTARGGLTRVVFAPAVDEDGRREPGEFFGWNVVTEYATDDSWEWADSDWTGNTRKVPSLVARMAPDAPRTL